MQFKAMNMMTKYLMGPIDMTIEILWARKSMKSKIRKINPSNQGYAWKELKNAKHKKLQDLGWDSYKSLDYFLKVIF